MATEKIKIASIGFKNNWYNLKDSTGRDISVGLVDKEGKAINPKLKGILENTKEGDEVEMDLREWNGKYFGNDIKAAGAGGAKSFAPKDKSFEAALAAAQAVGSMLGGRETAITPSGFDTLFEHVHAKIMSKASK